MTDPVVVHLDSPVGAVADLESIDLGDGLRLTLSPGTYRAGDVYRPAVITAPPRKGRARQRRDFAKVMATLRAATTDSVMTLPDGATIEWITVPTWAHRSTDPGARA